MALRSLRTKIPLLSLCQHMHNPIPAQPRVSLTSPPSYTMARPNQPRDLQDLKEAWHFGGTPTSLSRSFKFRDFDAAWSFMSEVAAMAKIENHHPEWSNVNNRVYVRWTTHHKNLGVRKKDRIMATVCDELAEVHGGKGLEGRDGEELADRATTSIAHDTLAKDVEKDKIETEEEEQRAEGSLKDVGGQPS